MVSKLNAREYLIGALCDSKELRYFVVDGKHLATFSQKRMSMVATCARGTVLVRFSMVAITPVMRPTALALATAFLA